MGGQYGVSQLAVVVRFAAEGLNVVHGLANKKGIFTLFNLGDEAMELGRVDWDELGKEAGELDKNDQENLLAEFAMKLQLSGDAGKSLEVKIESGALQVIDLVGYAKQSYEWGKAWYQKTQEILSLPVVPV